MIARRPMATSLLPTWLEQQCDRNTAHFERAGALYDSWRAYAHARNLEPGSPPEFATAMEARGFAIDQLRGDRFRIRWGLRLRAIG